MPRKTILKIGVTGGIGSGKSEVCKIFESLGVAVLYADDIAKDLSNNDPDVQRSVRELLGDRAYTSDGILDRAYVAGRIFASTALRKKMNSIVHPRVERTIALAAADLERAGKRLVIVEAALIFEAGLEQELDAVLVVDANEDIRIERVVGRDGVSRGQVLERMAAQKDQAAKIRAADYVIFNNGTKKDLERQVRFFHSIFQNLAGINS